MKSLHTIALSFLTLATTAPWLVVDARAESDATVAAAPVPAAYQPLYAELDTALRTTEAAHPVRAGVPLPVLAPNLALAASFYSPTLADRARWSELLRTLDAFAAMGARGVMVQVAAPDLALGDTDELLGFYRQLAAEIRARHLQLYVDHFVNLPFAPNRRAKNKPDVRIDDTPEGRQAFLDLLEDEVTLIHRELKPDYLSLLTEPGVAIVRTLHLSFTSDILSAWVGKVSRKLKQSGASPRTRLGAGIATFEPEVYATKFARQPDLDFIDFHVYPLLVNGADQVAQLSTLIHAVRKIRPEIGVTFGEAWLFKTGTKSVKPGTDELFLRNIFSFWAPLDQGFFSLLAGISQQENVSVVVPFFSQYLFSYYTFGTPEAQQLPSGSKSFRPAWRKASAAIDAHRFSPTGEALSRDWREAKSDRL